MFHYDVTTHGVVRTSLITGRFRASHENPKVNEEGHKIKKMHPYRRMRLIKNRLHALHAIPNSETGNPLGERSTGNTMFSKHNTALWRKAKGRPIGVPAN